MELSGNRVVFAQLFLKRAKADLKSSEHLLFSKDYADSVYHAQQAAEKAAKAVLVLQNKFIRAHVLSGILTEALVSLLPEAEVKEIISLVSELEQHWVRSKYPFIDGDVPWDPIREYRKSDAEKALGQAKQVMKKMNILCLKLIKDGNNVR